MLLSGFAGHYETYWGPNILKFHSEYLGLAVAALAVVGAGTTRRRLAWWLLGLGALFFLVSMGSGTPFFPALDDPIKLRLVETRTFGSGVVYLRYQDQREGGGNRR